MSLLVGGRFGAYEIIAPLGAGGMGEVYRARDPRLEREVALKVLPAVAVADETARSRLLREARMAAKLNHPNVCTIHEVGEAEGQAYIAMELVAGQTLAERLAGARLSSEEVVRLGHQMADALSHAHEHGVVHRDFKAANVIVTPEGRAKVLDFGLAKPLLGKDLEAATTLTQASLTEAGAIVGTLAYMAPEQLRGRPADARSDLWALGVVLYEMAAGRRPFGGDTGFELSSAILNQAPKALPAGVPPPFATIIERCLAKEPAQRYQRAGEVRSALEALQQGSAPAAWPRWRATLVPQRWNVLLALVSSVIIVLAALDVGGVRSRVFGRGNGGGRAIRMAVLPFANLSGDPEQEYFSDGLTQEMIAQLGRLHPDTLSVIARTSVMRYKKAETPIDQIGRELKVDYVLEGSAQREGNHVRITAELIRVGNQTQLWADSFEREMSGILALQSEVARKVADALALKLLPAEQTRLASARTVNPEAYEAYLKGRLRALKQTREDFDIAERYFRLALEKDPGFAPAYVGLGSVNFMRADTGFTAPSAAFPKACEFLKEAESIDDSSSEVHVWLGNMDTGVNWDWRGGEQEFRRALELNPQDSDAHFFLADLLLFTKRVDGWKPEIQRALELDPLNEFKQSFYGWHLNYLRRYDEAITIFQRLLPTAPNKASNYLGLWGAYYEQRKYGDATAAAKEYFTAIGEQRFADALANGGGEAGYVAAMRRVGTLMAEESTRRHVPAIRIARMFAHAGDTDAAMSWLEQAYEARESPLLRLGVFWDWDSLHSDPRFQALLRKMNLPVELPGTPHPTGAAS